MLSNSRQTQQLDNLLEQTTQELRWLDTELRRCSGVLPEYASLAAALGAAIRMLVRAREVAGELDHALSAGGDAVALLHRARPPF